MKKAIIIVFVLAILSGCTTTQESEREITLPEQFTFYSKDDQSSSGGDRQHELWLSFDGEQITAGKRYSFVSVSEITRTCEQELDSQTKIWKPSLARYVSNSTRIFDENGKFIGVNQTWTQYDLNESCYGPAAFLSREELKKAILAGNYSQYRSSYQITNITS